MKGWVIDKVIEDPNWSAVMDTLYMNSYCDCIPLEHLQLRGEVKEKEDEIPDISELFL
jgi:hypothetical protein